MKKVVICGGGASGMMAALSAAENKENHVLLLERQAQNITSADADVNGDGKVTIGDVVELIQLILNNEQ